VRINELTHEFVASVVEKVTPKGFRSAVLNMYHITSRRDSKTQHLDAILSLLKPNRTFPLHLAKPMLSFITIGDM
jgi:hypothetical protein